MKSITLTLEGLLAWHDTVTKQWNELSWRFQKEVLIDLGCEHGTVKTWLNRECSPRITNLINFMESMDKATARHNEYKEFMKRFDDEAR